MFRALVSIVLPSTVDQHQRHERHHKEGNPNFADDYVASQHLLGVVFGLSLLQGGEKVFHGKGVVLLDGDVFSAREGR